jgi:hypothetical protein
MKVAMNRQTDFGPAIRACSLQTEMRFPVSQLYALDPRVIYLS